jgi:TolB-like protein
LCALVFGAVSLFAAETARPKIAVMDFEDDGAPGARQGKNLALLIMAELSSKDKVAVLEREAIDLVLKEHEISAAGLSDQGAAIKTGVLLGADFILTGRLYKSGGKIYVNLKIINCSKRSLSGSVLSSDSAGFDGALPELAKSAAAAVMKKFPAPAE